MQKYVIEKQKQQLEERMSILDSSIMLEFACGRQCLSRCKKLNKEYSETEALLNKLIQI